MREKSDYDFSSVALETVEIGHTQQQELSLRDYILDIEERIFNADFGDAFDDENERQLVSFLFYCHCVDVLTKVARLLDTWQAGEES